MRTITLYSTIFSIVLLLLQSSVSAWAQSTPDLCPDNTTTTIKTSAPLEKLETVQVDLSTQDFSTALPFHQGFVIKGKLPKDIKVDCIELQIWPRSIVQEYNVSIDEIDEFLSKYRKLVACSRQATLSNKCKLLQGFFKDAGHFVFERWQRPKELYTGTEEFVLPVYKPLRTSDIYFFAFTLQYTTSPKEQSLYTVVYEDSTDRIKKVVPEKKRVPGSSDPETKTKPFIVAERARAPFTSHFNTDFGVMHAPGANYWGITSALHFYPFSPINKKSDLMQFSGLQRWGQRISVFAGLSFQEIASERNVENVLSIGTPIIGIGIRGFPYIRRSDNAYYRRIAQPIRINFGLVWFNQDIANPLVNEKKLVADFFFSTTVDTDLLGILGPILTGIF